jgi:glycosyltransferase involved in cell wall biosynthesis
VAWDQAISDGILKMSKTFVTIFPFCENVHLTKDLGQIPFFLHKKFGYSSKVVCYRHHQPYHNLAGEVEGLAMEFIPNTGRWSFMEKSVLKYIYRNARKMDVLNLYIFSKHAFVYGLLYKFLNTKGFLYLKLDGYNETFSGKTKIRHSVNPVKNFIFKLFEARFIQQVDLISIENSEGEQLVKEKFPLAAHKTMFLPVGVNDIYLERILGGGIRSFEQKEKIILTVGRIGEGIKNNEMLLRALAKVDLNGWKMVFVGPVNPAFKEYYHIFLAENPGLEGKIEFTGEIRDRGELYDWYNRSRVFCMTSFRESFCHSIGEALYFGNFIIGSDGIMSMKDISNNGEFGITVKSNDDEALAGALQDVIDGKISLATLYPLILRHSRDKFTWSKIIESVYKKVENK